jgi:hypothetical protein
MSSSSKENQTLGLHSSVTMPSLQVASQSIKKFLEQRIELILQGDEHYLIDVKEGDEAHQAWREETLDDKMKSDASAVRLISRMMTGVVQKRKNELFPWFTFCFKPAMIDEGDGTGSAFLNLKAVKNISPRLWGMVRIHQPNDEKRSAELCVHVTRNLPLLDEVVDPQLRIPFKNHTKLQKDERVKSLVPNAFFSDNMNLGSPLQIQPSAINIAHIEDGNVESFVIHHQGDDNLTICEISLLDFEGESIALTGVEISGIQEGQVIKAGKKVKVKVKRLDDTIEEAAFLQMDYFTGVKEDLDEDDEMMADEELMLNLQGSEEWNYHIFLSQGEAFNLLKEALLNPDNVLEQKIQEVNLHQLIEGKPNQNYVNDEVGDDEEEPPILMLNEADFDTGTLGTVSLCIKSNRPNEDFEHMLSEDDESEIDEAAFTFADSAIISEGFKTSSKTKSTKGKKSKKPNKVNLDLIYLGQLKFYNHLRTIDQLKFKDFLLNCIAAASLVRILRQRKQLKVDDSSLELDITTEDIA